jgi:hypothetical protein
MIFVAMKRRAEKPSSSCRIDHSNLPARRAGAKGFSQKLPGNRFHAFPAAGSAISAGAAD